MPSDSGIQMKIFKWIKLVLEFKISSDANSKFIHKYLLTTVFLSAFYSLIMIAVIIPTHEKVSTD